MEKNIYYPLDYGWYDSKEKWNHFCSSNCRFFSECSGKGGFCSSIERRDIQFENKELRNGLLQETCGVYRGVPVVSGGELRRTPLFWHFPAREGIIQPWRRKLWDLKK
ncbi:MAG TPA: hypothetical protein DEA91_10760 [Paenibacillus sp.]|nr:hypothetical protein [Paenibacillus sp.]